MFECVAAGDVRCDHLQLVHVGHEPHCRPPAHSTLPAEEQGPAGAGEHAVHASHVVQHLMEHEYVQVNVLPP